MPKGCAGRYCSSRGSRGRGGSRESSSSTSNPGTADPLPQSSVGSFVSPDRTLSLRSVPWSMTASAGDVLTELLQLLRDQVRVEMASTASSALVSPLPISQPFLQHKLKCHI